MLQGDTNMAQHNMHGQVRLLWGALLLLCTCRLGPALRKVHTQPWHASVLPMPSKEGLTKKWYSRLTGLLTE